MDTHDEEFGPLIRKQIEADKKAKEQRDNTPVQEGEAWEPSKPSFSYPLEILRRHLLNESEARRDAIEYLDGGHVSPLNGSEKETRLAFIESMNIATVRIPQLVKAIEVLSKQSLI